MRRTKRAEIYCPSDRGVDERQLARGIEVELEHTKSRSAARCIALAHLHELPDYYTRLAKVERGEKRRDPGGWLVVRGDRVLGRFRLKKNAARRSRRTPGSRVVSAKSRRGRMSA